MKTFKDFYGNMVRLSFSNHAFSLEPKHVFVICRYRDKWLFTKHKKRGLEFPGGKVEAGESPEDAAMREVFEETGAKVDTLKFIGQYEVSGADEHFVKNIYFAEVKEIEKRENYLETDGPVLKETDLTPDQLTDEYSFIMKDDVLQLSLNFLKENGYL